ncbi:MAG TPA: NAD(P)(+) transhydrogenase (Re/Si-specific) subunit alpha, partial [Parafilimonas sp.]|nr:NAD(P)(+) transhydrogenase (Re/Si-specific) subunit alpha [Parafilimonas sp.]
MTLGILKEPVPETRVSLLPEAAASLTKQNITIQVEKNAGENAYAFDKSYQTKNINIAERSAVLSSSEILLSINPLSEQDIQQLKSGTILIGVYQPLFNYNLMKQWAQKNITVFSLDM